MPLSHYVAHEIHYTSSSAIRCPYQARLISTLLICVLPGGKDGEESFDGNFFNILSIILLCGRAFMLGEIKLIFRGTALVRGVP